MLSENLHFHLDYLFAGMWRTVSIQRHQSMFGMKKLEMTTLLPNWCQRCFTCGKLYFSNKVLHYYVDGKFFKVSMILTAMVFKYRVSSSKTSCEELGYRPSFHLSSAININSIRKLLFSTVSVYFTKLTTHMMWQFILTCM